MVQALAALGIDVDWNPAQETIQLVGCEGRILSPGADLYVANSGTTVRFLTPLVALGEGRFRLDGTPRMRERPIGDLLDGLGQLGVDVQSELGTGCPPVVVRARGLAGGSASIRADVSSQFLSGLLLSAPLARTPVTLSIRGEQVSEPYVRMTLAVMACFGVQVVTTDARQFRIPRDSGYVGREYFIEPDASGASYFFGAAAITGGEVTVRGLSRASLQGDVAFVDLLARMGCEVLDQADGITVRGGALAGIEADMGDISDTVQTLAVVALFARGPTTIRGVAHIRHKETDRIGALATELRKLGGTVDEFADGLRITPGELHAATLATYDDHRMAMSLALAGLRVPGVVIMHPECTAKTYPRFFDDLQASGGKSP